MTRVRSGCFCIGNNFADHLERTDHPVFANLALRGIQLRSWALVPCKSVRNLGKAVSSAASAYPAAVRCRRKFEIAAGKQQHPRRHVAKIMSASESSQGATTAVDGVCRARMFDAATECAARYASWGICEALCWHGWFTEVHTSAGSQLEGGGQILRNAIALVRTPPDCI